MVAFRRKGIRKLVVIVSLCLLVFIIHQLGYAHDFALDGELSEFVRIINGCTSNVLETSNNFHPIIDSGIPSTVHQLWKTTDVGKYSTELKASRESWKTMFESQNYTVKLWTDNDVLELIKAKYAWLLPTYEGYPRNIQRADMARLLVVHHEGGIYSDLDVYPSSAENIQCLQHLGLHAIFSPTAGTLGLSNHFFMAERGSPFLQWVLYEAKRRGGGLASQRMVLPYLQVFWSTGPMMLTAVFREYAWLYGTLRHDLGLLDQGYGGAVIRHAAGRSWQSFDGQALNYIADHAQIGLLIKGVACLFIVLGFTYVARRYHASLLWM
ncbi:nucleotide-diphospho-sugar transferase [Aspergillus leporis]|uniref:Nucleotide-diphospho-sugar transferase n=1 Tax=Aspergillus leporis TaxID=41062 RepID=A0A5N5WIY5_9EURO|nr:nucleotide-diphospho-sugar transferase [Aspergillus leporis]